MATGKGKRKTSKRVPSNTAAVARRFGWWAARGAGHVTSSAVRRGASTAGRASHQAHVRIAHVQENRRLHGRRAVVREGDGGPMSLDQVARHLMMLDQAQENAAAQREGRDPRRIAWAERRRPLPDAVVERAHAPLALGVLERRALARSNPEWDSASVVAMHDDITAQLDGRPDPVAVPAGPAPSHIPATAGGPTSAVPHWGGQAVVDLNPDRSPDVNEPANFEDLKNPGIEQQQWTEQLPAHAQAVVSLLAHALEGMQALATYHQQADSRPDIVADYNESASAMETVLGLCQSAAGKAEEWAASVQLPRYDQAS